MPWMARKYVLMSVLWSEKTEKTWRLDASDITMPRYRQSWAKAGLPLGSSCCCSCLHTKLDPDLSTLHSPSPVY